MTKHIAPTATASQTARNSNATRMILRMRAPITPLTKAQGAIDIELWMGVATIALSCITFAVYFAQ